MASYNLVTIFVFCACISIAVENVICADNENQAFLPSLVLIGQYLDTNTDLVRSNSLELSLNNVSKADTKLEPVMEAASKILEMLISTKMDNGAQQEIVNALRTIDRKLDVVHSEMQRLFGNISRQDSFSQIDIQVAKLNDVKGQYSEWLKYADNLSESRTKRFLSSCEQNGITDTPSFFHRIFVGNDDVRRPRKGVIKSGATKEYQKFATSMAAYFLQASLLSGVCSGLKRQIADMRVTIKQDAAIYGKYLNEMKTVMISDDLLIKSYFWVNAKKDLNQYLADYNGTSNAVFVDAFYKHLQGKYDYRKWLVLSYGDDRFFGTRYHDWYPTPYEHPYELIYNDTSDRSTFFYNLVRTGGRNTILATTKSASLEEVNNFKSYSERCFNKVNPCRNGLFDCWTLFGYHETKVNRVNNTFEYVDPASLVGQMRSCNMGPTSEPVINIAIWDNDKTHWLSSSGQLISFRRMKFAKYLCCNFLDLFAWTTYYIGLHIG